MGGNGWDQETPAEPIASVVMVIHACVQLGREEEYDPPYLLERFDPEYQGGQGYAWLTRDPRRAQRFGSYFEALGVYEAVPKSRPVREDGQPNQPCHVYTVEILPFKQAMDVIRGVYRQ